MDKFLEFPPEIQIQIWQHAISKEKPRNVQVTSQSLDGDEDSAKICISTAIIPPLLHACKGSRAVSMERWSLSFPEVPDHDFEPVALPLPRIVSTINYLQSLIPLALSVILCSNFKDFFPLNCYSKFLRQRLTDYP